MKEPAQVMVVSPHPDDAEFGVGGTVVHWVREGKLVVYVVCTNGDKGTRDRNLKPEVLAQTRQQEERAAAAVLGVAEVVFLGYPDQGLEDTPQFRKDIVRQIRLFRPEIVATADPYHRYIWHRDHRITGQVTLDAVFPYARDHLAYPDLLAEGLEPHKVKEVWLWASDEPNHRVNITDTWDTKLAALRCHQSQLPEAHLAELAKRLRERYTTMAQGEDYELAEAFYRAQVRW
ncbi:MAG: PIG-L deacetylase family protein [Chloroflexota bacterium]